MAFLSINGISIGVLSHSARLSWQSLGDRRRAASGASRVSEQAEKLVISAETPPMKEADAAALSALLRGRGHNWRFADAFSFKGLGTAAAPTGTVTFNVAGGVFGGKKVQVAASSLVQWTPTGPDSLSGDYTVTAWWLDSTWKHVIVRRRAGTLSYYLNGAIDSTHAWSPKVTVNAGVLQLGDGTNADDFSDLVALPFAVPTSWPAELYASTRSYPNCPRLEVGGTLLGSPTTPREMLGQVASERHEPHADSEEAQGLAGRRLELSLEDV